MRTTAPKPATTPMPGPLSAPACDALLVPPLAMPQRGPQCQQGSDRVWTLILWLRSTGRPWHCLPIPHARNGQRAIQDTPVYNGLARGADDGALGQAVVASVRPRAVVHALSACSLATGPIRSRQQGRW